MDWSKAVDKKRGLRCAARAAQWLYNVQEPEHLGLDLRPETGGFAYAFYSTGSKGGTANWTTAFGAMGLLAAGKVFEDDRFRQAGLLMGSYLRSFQVFSPFMKDSYGAINEGSQLTEWCFPRDAVSAAWSFLVIYRETGDPEYLERARLFAEWYFKHALDKEGWPISRIAFSDARRKYYADIEAKGWKLAFKDSHGYYQGGGLNFLKRLAAASGDKKWAGKEYLHMANMLVDKMQEPCGNYNSIKIETRKFGPPKYVKDDFCSVGLIGAYKLTGNRKFAASAEKYLRYAFSIQQADGTFKDDESVAAIPVVLNAAYEAEGVIDTSFITESAVKRSFDYLLSRQYDGWENRRMTGGFVEENIDINAWPRPEFCIHARGHCYALLFLLKACGGAKFGLEA